LRIAIVLVDALRHDWVTPERMPFTASLAAGGLRRSIRDTFGFAGIRPAIFYGLEPADSGLVFLYERASSGGTFRWLRCVPPPLRKVRAKRVAFRVANRLRRIRNHRVAPLWDLSGVPWDQLVKLRYAEPLSPLDPQYLPGKRSVLAEYQESEIAYFGYPHDDQRTANLTSLARSRLRQDSRFAWVHFAELDWTQHEHGPDSDRVLPVLADIDGAIERFHALCVERWKEPFLLAVFGDHGAVEVHRTIDVEAHLGIDPDEPRTRVGIDYFVDSTMARFWCERPDDARRLRERLATIEGGRVVDPDELPALGCRYHRDTFGDVFFCLEEGALFSPCFFHRGAPLRGMHGYLPGGDDDVGARVVHTHEAPLPEIPDGVLAMTDLHALIRNAQGNTAEFRNVEELSR